MTDVPLREKMKWYILDRVPQLSRDLDEYLSLHLPDLIDYHNLATVDDIIDLEKRMEEEETRIKLLENWKDEVKDKLDDLEDRVKKLEKKYNIG